MVAVLSDAPPAFENRKDVLNLLFGFSGVATGRPSGSAKYL